jgi:hypothetical protein
MKVYLVGLPQIKCYNEGLEQTVSYNLLEAFPTMTPWLCSLIKSKPIKSFMLDSGAFSFLNQTKKNIGGLSTYIDNYISFINNNKIDLFFEMDIDGVIPLKEIETIREKIEGGTYKKCIPVWHKSRGIQYFKDMCDQYNYVAIGGLIKEKSLKTNLLYSKN